MKKISKNGFFHGGLAAILTASVLCLGFLIGGMYPFGSGTLSWCDMNQQVIPLFADFKDILRGEQSLFLNTANAGGRSFYGVFFFFLSSPFSFSVAFTDKADIPFLMNILVILKLCLAAFTAAFVISRLYPKLNLGFTAAMGCSYALCGYGMLFYQNIMWLDVMYLFPLVVSGCYALIKNEKILPLALSLTVTVIFNFYLSFMVFLFVILFFFVLAVTGFENRKIYIRLGISGLVSLLASAFVWLPCLLEYFSSARTDGFLKELSEGVFFAPYETTLPVLLSSGICFAAVVLTLPRLSNADKNIKRLSLVFFLTAIPLIIEPFNLMWHTGSYMSFPARYGFIPVFLGLLLFAEGLAEGRKAFTPKWLWFAPVLAVILVFCLRFTDQNTEMLSRYVGTLWGDEYSLKGLSVLCAAFAICYLALSALLRRGSLCKRTAAILLCIIVAAEGLCSVKIYMLTAKENLNIERYGQVMSLKITAREEGFYRVNTQNKITDANMTGAAGFNSLGHYTSLNNGDYMKAARQMGLSGYWMETGNWGGNILSDALLSVGYTAYADFNGVGLWRNPYFLPLGIKAKGEIPENLSDKDRLLSLGAAFGAITDAQNPVKKYAPASTEYCEIFEGDGTEIITQAQVGYINYKIKVTAPVTLYFDCYNGFSTNLVEEVNNSFSVSVNGRTVAASYPTQTCNGTLELGHFEDEEVNITLGVAKDTVAQSFGIFGIDEQAVKTAIAATSALELQYRKGSITGKADKGKYFVSVPKSDGLRVTLDGEKLDYSTALCGFIAVDVPHGGLLEISLVPKGLYLGIGLTILGIALFILLIFKNKKTILQNEKLCNIVFGVFIAVGGIVVMLVYITPLVVNLKDFGI